MNIPIIALILFIFFLDGTSDGPGGRESTSTEQSVLKIYLHLQLVETNANYSVVSIILYSFFLLCTIKYSIML